MQHDFILLDRSGSMSVQWVEAISSVNAYVAKLAADKVDTGVTLAAFDSDHMRNMQFQIIRDRITPSTWRPVNQNEVHPRGGTPLNDATGKIVNLAMTGDYSRVAIIIMTDGEENSSRELNVAQAKALLDRCRSLDWQVIFLGANFDNTRQSESYGNLARNTVMASAANLVGTAHMTASKRAFYGATGQSMTYTDAEKTAAWSGDINSALNVTPPPPACQPDTSTSDSNGGSCDAPASSGGSE